MYHGLFRPAGFGDGPLVVLPDGTISVLVDGDTVGLNPANELTTRVTPAPVVLSYVGPQLTSITRGTGETLILSYTGSILNTVTSSDGWTKNLNYTGNQLTSVTIT